MKRLEREHGAGEALLKWWQDLDERRADRAILRRAPDITAVSISAPYQRCYRRLLERDESFESAHLRDRLAAAVGLLAHVKVDSPGVSVPESLSARAPGDDQPAVSKLRFVRLLESPDLDSLFTGLRRALPLTGHTMNIVALTQDLLFWGDGVKKAWAYGYRWPD
ncbi:type I-E CRISPR-associated protein Cse2/CasB [Algiphilus sp.]|uniref:type I-E CRISPR-associated protein Cse2/CasB n=1 Tax=Algiphilus sp. TaxID=1872431 RepID=UPI0025C63AD2|nr:type I-E CRISPR-associated protein Cse2/CasB [Algiphilus sp.]MCK5771745.1 type I-E CRISPR-associated protein Cse2/CasB [Algiphilus sp.]